MRIFPKRRMVTLDSVPNETVRGILYKMISIIEIQQKSIEALEDQQDRLTQEVRDAIRKVGKSDRTALSSGAGEVGDE